MKSIPLTQGLVALVDDADFEWLSKKKWYAARRSGNTFYARRMEHLKGARKLVYMHRAIMNTPEGLEVDHINHDTLNNQRKNLRVCTRSENSRNTRVHYNSGTKLKGVRFFEGRYWMAQIWINNKKVHLGTFKSSEDAARAYDKAAKEHYGKFAFLNFPGED